MGTRVHRTGIQYAARAFGQLLAGLGCVQSTSRKGNCSVSAVAESFFHSLKVEAVGDRVYEARAQVQIAVADCILGFYNPLRLHSTLGYRTPDEFAHQFAQLG